MHAPQQHLSQPQFPQPHVPQSQPPVVTNYVQDTSYPQPPNVVGYPNAPVNQQPLQPPTAVSYYRTPVNPNQLSQVHSSPTIVQQTPDITRGQHGRRNFWSSLFVPVDPLDCDHIPRNQVIPSLCTVFIVTVWNILVCLLTLASQLAIVIGPLIIIYGKLDYRNEGTYGPMGITILCVGAAVLVLSIAYYLVSFFLLFSIPKRSKLQQYQANLVIIGTLVTFLPVVLLICCVCVCCAGLS